MIKKIAAALTALSLCIALAGCGNQTPADSSKTESNQTTDNSAEASSTEETANDTGSTVNDTNSAENEQTESSSAADSKEDEPSSNDGSGNNTGDAVAAAEFGEFTTKLVGNIIYVADGEVTDQPTDEELTAMVEAAVKQHKAATNYRDMQAFLDSMNFPIAKGPLTEISKLALTMETEEEFLAFIEDIELKYEIMEDIADALSYVGDQDIMSKLYNEEDPDNYSGLITQLVDSVSADNDFPEDDLYFTIWSDDMMPMGDEIVYMIYVHDCLRVGDELYCAFDLMSYDGLYEHYIDSIEAWYIEGQWGVLAHMSGYYDADDDDDFKGKSAQELYDMLLEELSAEESEPVYRTEPIPD